MVDSVLFSSNSDEWNTPQKVIDCVWELFGRGQFLDPCAAGPNTCPGLFLTKDDDGLAHAWIGKVFVNPPYSNIKAWSQKAIDNGVAYPDASCVFLCPARTDTRWFQGLLRASKAVCFVTGRLKFGDSRNSAPFPSAVFFLGGGVAASEFVRVFSGVGITLSLP